jgi:hypothetical protein
MLSLQMGCLEDALTANLQILTANPWVAGELRERERARARSRRKECITQRTARSSMCARLRARTRPQAHVRLCVRARGERTSGSTT